MCDLFVSFNYMRKGRPFFVTCKQFEYFFCYKLSFVRKKSLNQSVYHKKTGGDRLIHYFIVRKIEW